jgi:hypothetical protein
MRITLTCRECSKASAVKNRFVGQFQTEFEESAIYDTICPAGHRVYIVTHTLRHEMLFDIALNALKDGYRREAVTSFASAVERYYEFALRVLATKSGLTANQFEPIWKDVKKQSERQLGAYIVAWAFQFNSKPTLLTNKMSGFRNDVIHNGMLPTYEDAIKFGDASHAVIQGGIELLRKHCWDQIESISKERIGEMNDKMIEILIKKTHSSMSFQPSPTALNAIGKISDEYMSFDDILQQRGLKRKG